MSERLSFFATAIIAALGWLLTYYVDRVTSSPTIEYSISTKSVNSAWVTTYRLTNISRTKSFEAIEVHFLPRDGARIINMKVLAVEPASEGAGSSEGARFVIGRLMPGASIDFFVAATGPSPPKMHVDSPSALRLTPPSLETDLVRNEMCIVISLIVGWILLLIVIFLFRGRPKTEGAQTVRIEIANLGDLKCPQTK